MKSTVICPAQPFSCFLPPPSTHPEEKVQGLAAVEAAAEGDEDSGVGSPHSRPGWTGWADRVLYLYQAPGPDPAHYHRGSREPSRPGWEGRGEGGGGQGQGRKEKVGSRSVNLFRHRGQKEEKRRRHKDGKERKNRWAGTTGERSGRKVRGGMSSWLDGGRGLAGTEG